MKIARFLSAACCAGQENIHDLVNSLYRSCYLWVHPNPFSTAQNTIAEMFLSYLNSQQAKAFSASPTLHLSGTSFLE